MTALSLMARQIISRLGGGAGRRALLGAGAGTVIGAVGIPGVDLFPDGDGVRRRRRRRRVFNAQDRADISFISATLGTGAGKQVAMIIAARA